MLKLSNAFTPDHVCIIRSHMYVCNVLFAFRALTLLTGCQEEHRAFKKLSDEVLV